MGQTCQEQLIVCYTVNLSPLLLLQEFIREGCLYKLTKKGLQQRMFFLVRLNFYSVSEVLILTFVCVDQNRFHLSFQTCCCTRAKGWLQPISSKYTDSFLCMGWLWVSLKWNTNTLRTEWSTLCTAVACVTVSVCSDAHFKQQYVEHCHVICKTLERSQKCYSKNQTGLDKTRTGVMGSPLLLYIYHILEK